MATPHTVSAPAKPGFFTDIYLGTIKGDFAPRLGLWGRIAQIICAFIPGVGTLCALRDFFADRSQGDNFGAFLNFLGLIPLLGGFPKTAAAIRSARHFGKMIHAAQSLRHQENEPTYSQR